MEQKDTFTQANTFDVAGRDDVGEIVFGNYEAPHPLRLTRPKLKAGGKCPTSYAVEML